MTRMYGQAQAPKIQRPPRPGQPPAPPAIRIDVYPVGAFSRIGHAWRYLTLPASRFPAATRHPAVTWSWRVTRAMAEGRYLRQTVTRHVRRRQWHELRQTFNGYLAEPDPWPDGLTKCGRGWTKRAALRSLRRRARQAGATL